MGPLNSRQIFLLVIIVISISYVILTSVYEEANLIKIFDESPTSAIDGIDNTDVKEARALSSLDDSAYVFLALGAQANQMNCPAAVESLVRFGGWDGEVYFITDRENCFEPKEIIKNSGIKKENFHYVTLNEDFGGGGIDFKHPNIGTRINRIRSFSVKTRLFDFIPDQKIKKIAYADCDIIFAIPGCPKDFIESADPWGDYKLKFSKIFKDDKGNFDGVHAGTILAHRDHSQRAFEIWRNAILSEKDEGDNDALRRVYFEYQNVIDILEKRSPNQTFDKSLLKDIEYKNGKYINPLLSTDVVNKVQKGYPFPDNSFERFLDPTDPQITCMNHIPKARCVHFGRQIIQRFVNRFHLKTYSDGEYMYCTHKFLQPLLYGWFPFSYLPFCPKLEKIL